MNSIIYHHRFQSRNNNNYKTDYNDKSSPQQRRNFWRNHCIVVAVDVSEILDRIFCKCGLVDTFQEAYSLTALDRRQFAPPIENHWQRVVNMANTCETFNIEPSNVAHLIGSGFKSVTLLSMSKPKHLKKTATDFGVEERLKRCLNVLNDRRITALEPLHSLRRLLQSKRKLIFKLKHYEYLDLANVEAKKKLPLNRDYKMHQPMIARSTFKNYDTASLLGPRGQCYCNHSDIIKPRICLSSTSSSSGYSSGSSSMADVPDSPDSMKKLEAHFQAPPPSQATQIPPRLQQCQQRQPFIPFHRRATPFIRHLLPTTNLIHKTHPENRGCVTASGDHFPPLQRHHPRMHCPRPDCSWRLYSNQVEDHCLKMHRIAKDATGPIFTYTEVRQRINDPRTTNKFCGDVKLTLNTREVFDENKVQLWWGPAPFVFDNITFYLIVYKKIDQETGNAGRTMEPRIMFWIWTALPKAEAERYRYEIHLENGARPNDQYQPRHFLGIVQSLEVSHSDIIQHYQKGIVYFSQSYIRKTFRFTHNHHQPPPRTLDMNYTVKIMRQSL